MGFVILIYHLYLVCIKITTNLCRSYRKHNSMTVKHTRLVLLDLHSRLRRSCSPVTQSCAFRCLLNVISHTPVSCCFVRNATVVPWTSIGHGGRPLDDRNRPWGVLWHPRANRNRPVAIRSGVTPGTAWTGHLSRDVHGTSRRFCASANQSAAPVRPDRDTLRTDSWSSPGHPKPEVDLPIHIAVQRSQPIRTRP